MQAKDEVTVGPATQVGVATAAGGFVTALILVILGDHSGEAIAAASAATVTLVTVLIGRYWQAAAKVGALVPVEPGVGTASFGQLGAPGPATTNPAFAPYAETGMADANDQASLDASMGGAPSGLAGSSIEDASEVGRI